MKKMLTLSLALLAAMALPASAMALDVDQDYDVTIATTGDSEVEAGTLVFSLLENRTGYCDYYIEWISPTDLISAECTVSEFKTQGHRSCLKNAEDGFETLVILNDDYDCQGFDRFSLLQDVHVLVLGEDNDSNLNGLAQMSGFADVQSIEVTGS